MSDSIVKTQYHLYGIKNCETIKKARCWLDTHGILYRFYDYRVDGLTAESLQDFIDSLGWEPLLNTRGTTWRKLSDTERSAVTNAATAKALMLTQPAIIKRPLLATAQGKMLLGFSPGSYQQFFAKVQ